MATKAEAAAEIFAGYAGKELGTGDWHVVEQKQINQFADATLDHQFIHIDPEKSAKLSPYKVTVAHGFLTLSMVVHLGATVPRVSDDAYAGLVMGINYGLDRVRFPAPVKVDKRIRARGELISADLVNPTTIQLKQRITVEIEGEDKPGCVAETLTRLIYS